MIKKFILFSLLTTSTILNANETSNNAVVTTVETTTVEKSAFDTIADENNTEIQTAKNELDEDTSLESPMEEVTDAEANENNTIVETQMGQKIKNILGEEDFNTHINLINYIFSKDLNYIETLKELKENKLLKLDLNGQKYVNISFVINNSSLKSLKVIKSTLKSLGYYYYLTQDLNIKANTIIWNIRLKTEAAIDPLVLSEALQERNSVMEDIIKEGEDSWSYYINSENSKLYNTMNFIDNDQLSLKKPLKPYLIELQEDMTSLAIYSKAGNRWHPKIVFYDNELNVIEIVQKDKFHRYLKIYVPYNTKYIKIDDLFSLSNMNKGMKLTKE